MEEISITLKGRALKDFQKLKSHLAETGFSTIKVEKKKLEAEKIETSDLKGTPQHSFRVIFQPDKLTFSYSVGADRQKRTLAALSVLLNLLKYCETFYLVKAGELNDPLSPELEKMRSLLDVESYATARQLSEMEEKYLSLEKKYKDLVLSSEQNARILLECEKKKSEYSDRISELEAMDDEALAQEIFNWLKLHSGEISVPQFSKSYGVPGARVEEGLELLLKKGYIRKK